MDVSIIIPNRDSPLVGETLRSVMAQTALDCVAEVLVVGVDRRGLVADGGLVRWINTGEPVTAPVARNIGIRSATGSCFVFIDADCVAEPNWLEHLLVAQRDGHEIVGGAISLEARTYWQLCYNLTMFHEFLTVSPPGERQNLGTLNLCVAREVVERVGLFDERLVRGQDTEWTLRMRRRGYRLYFTPRAVVKHFPLVDSLWKILRTWYLSGSFNARIRDAYRDVIAAPPFYRWPLVLITASPVISLAITVRIFARIPRFWRYLHTAPVLFLTKIAWCWGAAYSNRSSEQ